MSYVFYIITIIKARRSNYDYATPFVLLPLRLSVVKILSCYVVQNTPNVRFLLWVTYVISHPYEIGADIFIYFLIEVLRKGRS
jgi:hypothetical protein